MDNQNERLNGLTKALGDSSAWLKLALNYEEFSIQAVRCTCAAFEIIDRLDIVGDNGEVTINGCVIPICSVPAVTALKLIMSNRAANKVTHDQIKTMLLKVGELSGELSLRKC